MIQSDSNLESAHFLFVIVKDDKVTIDAVVLRYQMKQRDPYISKGDVVASVHCRGIVLKTDTVISVLNDIVSNLEDGTLRLEVIKDFSIHLQRQLINLAEDRAQTVVEHSGFLIAVWESLAQLLILVKH